MKNYSKILLRVFAWIVLIFLINLFLYEFVYKHYAPFYWGSRIMADKYEYYKANKSKINVLFLGTSKFLHHIIPQQFDSIANQCKHTSDLYSFNYGLQRFRTPESITFFSKLIENGDLDGLKYVFFDLTPVDGYRQRLLHQRKTVYWLGFSEYIDFWKINWSSHISWRTKITNIYMYSISFLERIFNIGFIKEVTDFQTKTLARADTVIGLNTWKNNRGIVYLPLPSVKGEKLQKMQEDVIRLKQTSIDAFDKHEKKPYLLRNTYLYEKVLEMLHLAEVKGIHLIFVLNVRVTSNQYEELLPIFDKLSTKNKIIMGDGRKYPELFDPNLIFDPHHLSAEGAKIITEKMALEFCNITK